MRRANKVNIDQILDYYGSKGVNALKAATPKDTGKTANSWYYEIEKKDEQHILHFCNSNLNNGVPIAILIQYGHGMNNGAYVRGRDYINPALSEVFENLAKEIWKEVTIG